MVMNHQDVTIKLQTNFTTLDPNQRVGILWSRDGIRGWDDTKPDLAENVGQDYWEACISVPSGERLGWIWIVYDLSLKRVILWESTAKRSLVAPDIDSYMSIPWERKEGPMKPLLNKPFSTDIQNKTTQEKTPETASSTWIRLETCKDSNINVATSINSDCEPPQRVRLAICKWSVVLPLTVGVALLAYTAYRKFC